MKTKRTVVRTFSHKELCDMKKEDKKFEMKKADKKKDMKKADKK